MKLPIAAAVAVAAAGLFALPSHAAVIDSVYTPLSGTSWRVDLTVIHDGIPASITNFTVDFPDFTELVLVASPASWDTLLIQPDPGLPAAGFLDSLALTAGDALTGGSLGGFRVEFTYAGTPGALPFVISDAAFTPVFWGMTTATVVPEPGAALLAALGLAVVGLRASRAGRAAGTRDETAASNRSPEIKA